MKQNSIFSLMIVIFSPTQFIFQINNRTIQTAWGKSRSRSKPNFIKLFFIIITLLISSIYKAQTKEMTDIDNKAERLGISTTELQGIFNSTVRNGEGDYSQLDTLTNIVFTGETAGDEFGNSVSSAGDVNGDGYSDIIIGAWKNNARGTRTGRVYIYFGGTSMDSIADVTLTGEVHYYYFGTSVSTAGDVNGDGYSDVIIGAYNINKAYIYFGGTPMDDIADVTMTGEAEGDEFGISVSTAGDVNGDGYSDGIIGAEWNDAGGTWAGRAYIYFGGASMDNNADVILTGQAANDFFGISVSTAGDVNYDGYSDVIVGAYDALGNFRGRSYIYFGGTAMDNIADVTMTGEAQQDQFGLSVSVAGDVNGDLYDDVIVGARLNSAGGMFSGRSYIYFGGKLMDNIADVIMTGEAAFDYFGRSVSTAGDINKDGYSDVIVGAYCNFPGEIDAGSAYIYFGGTSMDNIADVIMRGEAIGDAFGGSVSTAGDINKDRYSDVIIGAYGNDAGRAYLYLIYQSANYVDVDVIINKYSLCQNYPNPFNPTTKISYHIPEMGFVTLKVYDILGKEIETLVNEENSPGKYEVEFNASSLSNGIYFYRIQVRDFVETKKMLLIK